MELSRSEYPSMLASLQPTPAVTILRDRLKKVQVLNTEVADWLLERRKVEEAYAQGLAKLAKRQPPGDQSELGIFRGSWSRIVESTQQLSVSHQQFAQKVESEIEKPLREYAIINAEWGKLKPMETNLSGIAKNIDAAEEKAEKLRKKGSRAKANLVAEAAAAVERHTIDWDSQAPFVFEKLQAVDEARCDNLRDTLTRYHTLELDQAQKAMSLAEESLGTLLDLSASEEIANFAAITTNGRPKIERQTSRAPSTGGSQGMPNSTPSIVTDDSVSVQSAGSGSGGGLHGLRRLGTVLRGKSNRNSTVPYMNSSTPARSTEKLPNKQQPLTPASPGRSDYGFSSSSRNLSVPMPGSPLGPDGARPQSPKANDLIGMRNGGSRPSTADATSLPPAQFLSSSEEPQKDSEGYTIPPPVNDIGGVPLNEDNGEPSQPQFKLEIKNDVIPEEEEEADAAISKVANSLRMQNTVSRKTRGRRDARDVRNTMFFPAGSGPPDPLGEMLSMHPTSPPLTPMKSSMSPISPMSPMSPMGRPSPGAPSDASDTQSIRSSRSVTSQAGGTIRHPDLHEPGLSSSLVESVSVNFEGGQPTKVLVIGEIALAYNQPQTLSPTPQPITALVRMDNFSVLEKVAPNPGFITAVPEKSGEYSVALTLIPRTAVAFKYQVHLEEAQYNDFLPIILSPVWRIEANQASVIINYRPNPTFPPVTLKNVIFFTGVEGASPKSCQSKPVGTFARDKGRIAWKLGDINLADASATGKLLARFALDPALGGVAKQGQTDMRWDISAEEASMVGSGLVLQKWVEGDAQAAAEEVDPFSDETGSNSGEKEVGGRWQKVNGVKKVGSGKYVAA